MKIRCLLLLFLAFSACKHDKKVNTSFYYWKTVYKVNPTEAVYQKQLNTDKLYVRMLDVDMDDMGQKPVPVSPVIFKDKITDTIELIPVVFIVNNVLKNISKPQLNELAKKITLFVKGKVEQAGKTNYNELQIDCDWTATTRDNYFYLLKQLALRAELKNKTISVTLRLHQLKNQVKSGIPPAHRAMLMCYNMGNLRRYGNSNSILDVAELKKYAGDNLSTYPMPVDIGLPLFNWAVAFRDKQYAGISKRIKLSNLRNKNEFIFIGNNLYKAVTDLPQYGLIKGDEIRWEDVPVKNLDAVAKYLSPLIKSDSLNLIYFHLDENVIKAYTAEELEKISTVFN